MSTTSPAFLLGTGPDRLFAEFASARLTVCCTADIDPRLPQPVVVNFTHSIRALSGPKMQALADAIERHQPQQLRLQQLRVNMREFCSLVVPRMVGVNELVLYQCDRLSAADLALLSAALTAAGVCLTTLECAVQNAEGSGMSDAVAALCSAHPSIECLSLPGLDDSDHHPDTRQRYPLIAALVGSVEPTRLRQIRLPNTPPPVDFHLLAIKAYEHQDKVDTMFFTFEGSPNSATLYAHADAYSKPRSGSWFAYELFE
jgi:hypothetical protein